MKYLYLLVRPEVQESLKEIQYSYLNRFNNTNIDGEIYFSPFKEKLREMSKVANLSVHQHLLGQLVLKNILQHNETRVE